MHAEFASFPPCNPQSRGRGWVVVMGVGGESKAGEEGGGEQEFGILLRD